MKISIKRHRRILLAASVAALALPVGAWAQDVAADGDNVIQDIIVTARKREERLQSTPVSVAAFSADALSKAGVNDFSEIASRVPGFTLNPDNISEPNVFLRGIGTDIESAASNPAVGFFLNDVYLARPQGTAMEPFDLERVRGVRGERPRGRHLRGHWPHQHGLRPHDRNCGYHVTHGHQRAESEVAGSTIADSLLFKAGGR